MTSSVKNNESIKAHMPCVDYKSNMSDLSTKSADLAAWKINWRRFFFINGFIFNYILLYKYSEKIFRMLSFY